VRGVVVKATAELNAKLEDERRMLLGQLQTLMDQLHRLLSELITSKDSYANEQKTYLSVASQSINQSIKVFHSGLSNLNHCEVH